MAYIADISIEGITRTGTAWGAHFGYGGVAFHRFRAMGPHLIMGMEDFERQRAMWQEQLGHWSIRFSIDNPGERWTYLSLPVHFGEAVWIGVPCWPFIVASAALWTFIRRRRVLRLRRSQCPRCGYDLRRLPSATCPECGGPAKDRP